MKKVWLVSHYAMPPHLEQRIKTLKYAEIMQDIGYEIKLFTASTIHNTDINLIEGKEKYIEKTYGNLNFVHIKVSNYKGNGISRILNMRKFSKQFFRVSKKFEKPFAIVADINCVNYRPILNYCKKNNVKLFADIRDLWPLSIVEYMGMSAGNPIIKYLYKEEKRLYKQSDGVIFSMEGGKEYITDKGWQDYINLDKIYYINNGVDIEEFVKLAKEKQIVDTDLESDAFKVVYCGAIRKVNDVMLLVGAAEKLTAHNDIEFLIYGNGDEKAMLENYCLKKDLKNVKFKGQVEKCYVPYILSKSNVNIINVKQTDVMKYGSSLNKLFDYLASGKPIVSNLKVKYDPILANECGIVTENQSPEAMAEAIVSIKKLSKVEYDKMCQNAFLAAKEFDFKVLTKKLVDIIETK